MGTESNKKEAEVWRLRGMVSVQFKQWQDEGRDLGDYKRWAAYEHLKKILGEDKWESYLPALLGPHGYTVYRTLRAQHEQHCLREQTGDSNP